MAKALHEVYDHWASEPTLAAIDDEGGTISYGDLVERSIELSKAILQSGAEPNSDRPVTTLLPRTCAWLVVYVATMRCGIPMLALSCDLRDEAAEKQRNHDVVTGPLRPQLLIYQPFLRGAMELLQSAASAKVPAVVLEELHPREGEVTWPDVGPAALLGYCFTGGTTRVSKAVRISHGMALHEVRQYPKILPKCLSRTTRFLQNSSAYWGAALLGQIDVALALGGAVVLCKADLPSEIVQVVNRFKITALGAVPSVLAHMSPTDMPEVQCVISWAEALNESTAARWQGVPLLDLLIASEYWLSLYSQYFESRSLRAVDDVDVKIISLETGDFILEPGEAGELCFAGPTVFPGYANPADDAGRFVEKAGQRYFRTQDLVKWTPRGLEFCGRCDDMTKVGGRWVDVAALESQIAAVPKVGDVKLVLGAQQRKAFFTLAPPCEELPGEGTSSSSRCTLRDVEEVQRMLPEGCVAHLMAGTALPRHAATGKVDRRLLLSAVQPMDITESVQGRQQKVLANLARAHLVAIRFCRNDPRRLVGLAFLWYWFHLCKWLPEERAQLARHFPCVNSALLAMARSLPLQTLQGLAAPGAAAARYAGRGLEWCIVFLISWPFWLTVVPHSWSPPKQTGTKCMIQELQQRVARHVWPSAPTCPCCGTYLVTLFPSITHCCNVCMESGGKDHGRWCGRRPVGEGLQKRCKHCACAVTFIPEYCCWACRQRPGIHGPRCAQKLVVDAEMAVEESEVLPVEEEAKPEEAQAEAGGEMQRTSNGDAAHLNAVGQINGKVCTEMEAKSDSDVEMAQDTEEEDGVPATTELSSVKALVARILCAPILCDDHSLRGIDSLRALRLVGAISQELGRVLELGDVLKCSSLKELLEKIRLAPAVEMVQDEGEPEFFRIWTFGWNNGLPWLYRSERPIRMQELKRAVPKLMERHPALRMRCWEPNGYRVHFLQAAANMDLLRSYSKHPSCAVPTLQRVINGAAESLFSCWSRFNCAPLSDDLTGTLWDLDIESEDPYAVWNTVHDLRRNFCPPFQLVLLRDHRTTETETGADHQIVYYVIVLLSHACADGSAAMSLIQDLASLLERRSLPKRPPHWGLILQDRLHRTLRGEDSKGDALFLDRRMDFFTHHFGHCRIYYQQFQVMPDEMDRIRRALHGQVSGQMLSGELLMLGMASLTLARVTKDKKLRVTIVHHSRDYPTGAASCVGFFTDFRVMDVLSSPHVSLLGFFANIANTVAGRRWRRPEPLEPLEALLNLVPASYDPVGCLVQEPSTWQRCSTPTQVHQKGSAKNGARECNMQIEQVDRSQWDFVMWLDETRFPPPVGLLFREEWWRVITDLEEDPLQGAFGSQVHPE